MAGFIKGLCAIVIALPVAGCYTPPTQRDVEHSRAFSASYDVVWAGIIKQFSSSNIQIKTIEKASGIIYAERSILGLGYKEFADCGNPGLLAPGPVTASFNVFVQREEGDEPRIRVTVNSSYSQMLRWENAVKYVDCVSTGALEAKILDSI